MNQISSITGVRPASQPLQQPHSFNLTKFVGEWIYTPCKKVIGDIIDRDFGFSVEAEHSNDLKKSQVVESSAKTVPATTQIVPNEDGHDRSVVSRVTTSGKQLAKLAILLSFFQQAGAQTIRNCTCEDYDLLAQNLNSCNRVVTVAGIGGAIFVIGAVLSSFTVFIWLALVSSRQDTQIAQQTTVIAALQQQITALRQQPNPPPAVIANQQQQIADLNIMVVDDV